VNARPPQVHPATAAPVVTAIVVSHDSGPDLAACVADLLAQDVPVQVIVVDNASHDGSAAALPEDPALEWIGNARNLCRLAPDSVARLCRHFEVEPELGILGARLLNADGSAQAAAERRTPVPLRAIREALGAGRKPATTASTDAGAPLRHVEATSGALMLVPRTVFERLQGFDPGYLLHCEDLDLCRRVLDAGYRIAVARDVSVTHLKGTSSRKRPVWVEWQKHRGMWRYFRKFDAATSPWWLRLLVPLGLAAHFPLAALRAWWRGARS